MTMKDPDALDEEEPPLPLLPEEEEELHAPLLHVWPESHCVAFADQLPVLQDL